ncbi:hypothetical protein BC827DRAFT_151093 [Russula dissimulans]|nr:hypothetical protein BC827DRAFT_151093 [Russula dissimulans]
MEVATAATDEIFSVHDTIRHNELEIESIDTMIQSILREVQLLRAKKERHMDTIAKCRRSISLAYRAPDDVLALIFEQCAAGGWVNAPLVISHVCAKWRRASFSPRVWSHVHLTNKSLKPVAKTRLWLSRALQAPLCVTIDVRILDPHIFDAFELILERAPQWRTLTLNTRFVVQANGILSQCRRHIRYLHMLEIKSFSIGVATGQGVDELLGLDDTFRAHDAPSLSHIRVVSNRFPLSIPPTVVDLFLQLDDIVSSRPSLSAAWQMLGTLPALRGLTLVVPAEFARILSIDGRPAPVTCLPQLEHLVIDAPPDFNDVLRYIKTPVLRSLHLRSIVLPFTDKALLQFLSSWSSDPPTVTKLENAL